MRNAETVLGVLREPTHGAVTGEPVAGKLARRVREGAAREKGQKWHLARQPTSTQESSGRAQAHEAERCGTRAIWLKLNCLNPNLQKVQIATLRKAPETGVTSCIGMRRWPVQLPGNSAGTAYGDDVTFTTDPPISR